MPQIPFFAKEWREFRGLSLHEAARLADLKVSHISAIEQRNHHFDEHDLAALANAYDIHPAMLLNINPLDPEDLKYLEAAIASDEDSKEG
jgi:transcriptional regulator with XRE-family HTH domain